MKAVSKRSISLLPQKEAFWIDLQPVKQDTESLAKNWCVEMKDYANQPDEPNSHLRTYLKARYRLSTLLRAQRNDRMTSSCNRWSKNVAKDKEDLKEES